MNAYPVRLAAGLALMAWCALAEEPPNAKMAEPQTPPVIADQAPPGEVGLNEPPIRLPTHVVDGLRERGDQVNRDLKLVLQREKMISSHALYQTALTKKMRLEAFSPLEEGTHRAVALPVLRSSW